MLSSVHSSKYSFSHSFGYRRLPHQCLNITVSRISSPYYLISLMQGGCLLTGLNITESRISSPYYLISLMQGGCLLTGLNFITESGVAPLNCDRKPWSVLQNTLMKKSRLDSFLWEKHEIYRMQIELSKISIKHVNPFFTWQTYILKTSNRSYSR